MMFMPARASARLAGLAEATRGAEHERPAVELVEVRVVVMTAPNLHRAHRETVKPRPRAAFSSCPEVPNRRASSASTARTGTRSMEQADHEVIEHVGGLRDHALVALALERTPELAGLLDELLVDLRGTAIEQRPRVARLGARRSARRERLLEREHEGNGARGRGPESRARRSSSRRRCGRSAQRDRRGRRPRRDRSRTTRRARAARSRWSRPSSRARLRDRDQNQPSSALERARDRVLARVRDHADLSREPVLHDDGDEPVRVVGERSSVHPRDLARRRRPAQPAPSPAGDEGLPGLAIDRGRA